MINTDTDKIIIVCYSSFSGGKFLLNSLGLSNKIVLQDINLATQQANGNFSTQEKFEYLATKLKENGSTKEWNDLGLGCFQFFGVPSKEYLQNKVTVERFDNKISNIIDNDLTFFLVAHNYIFLPKYLEVWKNARIIAFENSDLFIKWRTNGIQTENAELSREKLADKNVIHYFDNNNYFSKIKTVDEIEKMYKLLDLPDFDRELVSSYYDLWMGKLIENKLYWEKE